VSETPPEVPILRIRNGARAGTALVIVTPAVIGREADIALDDDEVSRRHARIRIAGDQLVIEDLASSNGTWVNTRRVEQAVLRPGDVVTLGRTILDVVASRGGTTTTRRGSDLEPSAEGIPRSQDTPGRIEYELRPITALFADVVGSTAVGERLDPDEVSALIGECVTRMTRAVEHFGGAVSTYTGDGIAAFFGLEQASAEDAEHAARAAIAIISAIGGYATEVERAWDITDFNVRVGLNTGDAAVSAMGSADRPNVALGDTTNIAARLQSMAEPGTIAIGDETADELRGRFLIEPLGEVRVRGRRASVRAWQLRGALEGPGVTQRRRIVGRDPELTQLRVAVDQVCAGRGGALFVVGDLGMGKTRLIAELEDLVGHRATLLQAFCAAVPAPPPYGPFNAILRAWLGLEPDERGPAVRATLQLRLEDLDGLTTRTADGLALLLNLRPEDGEQEAVDPAEAYTAWVETLGKRRPLVIALDDVHWLEPSSALLALRLAELAMRLPLLFVSTLRPDRDSHGWRIRTSARATHPSRAREVNLDSLSDEHARELLDELAPTTEPTISEEVVRLAEGNPLFVEQLLRAFREGGSFPPGPTSVRTVATARLLPPALASIFVGRIDLLSRDVRRVAQSAATIGRTFHNDLLTRVVGADAVTTALPALINAGIVAERDPPPGQSWSFTHALLRDAALSTLVRSQRREIFGRIAAAFEESIGDAGDEHLELLAYYYARSENAAKALHYQERAAEKAFRVGADTEASDRLRKAAQLAEQLADEEAVRRITARLES
jgi:class 3 adenylate cyclase